MSQEDGLKIHKSRIWWSVLNVQCLQFINNFKIKFNLSSSQEPSKCLSLIQFDWLIESIKVWYIEALLYILCLNWLHDNISSKFIIIIKHFLMCISIISSAFITTSCHTLSYITLLDCQIVIDLHFTISLSIIVLCSLNFTHILQGLVAAVEAGHEMSTVPLLRITRCAFMRLIIFAEIISVIKSTNNFRAHQTHVQAKLFWESLALMHSKQLWTSTMSSGERFGFN